MIGKKKVQKNEKNFKKAIDKLGFVVYYNSVVSQG